MAASRRKPARKGPAPARGKKVLGVDVDAYARQLLAESGGDVRLAHAELEHALDALRAHLHACMEERLRTVRLPRGATRPR